jgi:hypothetical protein
MLVVFVWVLIVCGYLYMSGRAADKEWKRHLEERDPRDQPDPPPDPAQEAADKQFAEMEFREYKEKLMANPWPYPKP